MVILTALLSASKERRSDMISAVAPPSFCPEYQIKFQRQNMLKKFPKSVIYIFTNIYLSIDAHLAELVKILKVCLVKSVPHYFNVHVIQVLQDRESKGNVVKSFLPESHAK